MIGRTNTQGYKIEKPEYTELEYIESTGTQYIDTGVYVNSNFRWEMDFQFTDISESGWCGTGESKTASIAFAVSPSTSNYFKIGANVDGTWVSKDTTILIDTARHTLYYESGFQSVDGIQIGDYLFYSTQGKNTFPLAVFCTQWGTNPTSYSSYCKMKIYSCKIYDNGALIRNFKPALDINNVACLYDEVSKTYFYNAGTGTFNAGSVVGEEDYSHTELEYIESTGTQYIDTGLNLTKNTKMKLSCIFSKKQTAGYTFIGTTGGTDERLYIGTNANNIIYAWSNTVESSGSTINNTSKYDIELTYNYWKLNDTQYNFNNAIEPASTLKTLTIFTANGMSTWDGSLYDGLRLYSFKIYDNDVLVRDYIPVLDENNIACLYDKVTENYFYNAGTGSFTAGSIIV